ncbi:MAG: ABC transporter permease [Thermoproteota archaeon]|jgi:simple sugar transport system permease protein|uniref:ABC transporter permease n=1 Tax=Candidatus Methanodesulfokora washburnensis TaxID=2478471 RepID=A0A429GPU7_9CREN|nr:ABC transporter permease [Candidatus Methanodesulfokores washburnensis]RSN75717.1 ABC transporter permease [Candidatus Methanodesulfokores washburnensis]RZN62517.1 MAG: ABC transporter permease [Candidatus Methanodesulfokores washburnensis]TDA40644.1 MAG: ABC transporter permease [Candidatus Korarchaeota archaeon]
MRIAFVKREKAGFRRMIAVRTTAMLLALASVGMIFWFYGADPVEVYREIFLGAFGTKTGVSEVIVKLIPLLLCGVGLSLVFKGQIWNIGAEGQLILGAIAATGVGLWVPLPSYLVIPAMFLSGFLAGALWALIPAVLRAKMNVNEVITTLLMNYVAIRLLYYLVYGPWRAKEQWGNMTWSGFAQTAILPDHATLQTIPGTRIHYITLIIALTSLIFVYLLMNRTSFGYELKVVGDNLMAARFAGINISRVILISMIISGGLAGIAGVGEIAGIQHRLRPGFSVGYGYTAIIIAWLGGLNPLAVLVSTVFFSGILVGGSYIQISFGMPVGVINMFNGIILLFLLASEVFLNYSIKLRR